MKTILWVSRHEMTAEQKSDLLRGVGEDAEIIQFPKTIHDTDEIVNAAKQSNADIICVVLPIHLLGELIPKVDENIPVLMAKNGRKMIRDDNGNMIPEFIHLGWTRYKKVDIVTEPW